MNKQEKIIQHEGTYFTRYVPEKKCSSHTVVARKAFNKKINKITKVTNFTHLKFAISSLFILLFMAGVAVSLYTTKESSLHEPSSFDADGLVLVSKNYSSTAAVSNGLKQQSRQEWMTFANDHQLKTATCAWEQLAECQQHYSGWMFVVLAE